MDNFYFICSIIHLLLFKNEGDVALTFVGVVDIFKFTRMNIIAKL